MKLLYEQLNKEFHKLHEKKVRIRFLGDKTRLSAHIVSQIQKLEELTEKNDKLNLNIALDYSGTYDIVQAVNGILATGKYTVIDEGIFSQYLLTYPDPNPDLLIRTSGESRLSNFMLWQLAYSEMYFTDKFWPDFDKKALDSAIHWFINRERRFGMISEQL
jgi:undecaprenyl diphosphate synthase